MAQVEAPIKPIIPEGFTAVSPEIAVFLTALISYVNHGGSSTPYGENNVIHFNHRSRTRKPTPIFFSSFYYEKSVELLDGTFILGGLDRTDGKIELDGIGYDLYRSHDVVYDTNVGFTIIETQTGTPVQFFGEGAVTIWKKTMTKKGIQRLSRKLFINS